MATMTTAVARVIAAVAYAICAVITIIPGVRSGSKTALGLAIVEAVSSLTVGALYLIVPVEHIFLPVLLGIFLWAVPTWRGVRKPGQ